MQKENKRMRMLCKIGIHKWVELSSVFSFEEDDRVTISECKCGRIKRALRYSSMYREKCHYGKKTPLGISWD